jgi:hypothetical protein
MKPWAQTIKSVSSIILVIVHHMTTTNSKEGKDSLWFTSEKKQYWSRKWATCYFKEVHWTDPPGQDSNESIHSPILLESEQSIKICS